MNKLIITASFLVLSNLGYATHGIETEQTNIEAKTHYAARTDEKIGTNVGDYAPDFTLKDLDGNDYTLSNYNGKSPVVINFFEKWCPPCIIEMPSLNELARDYDGKVSVLAIFGNGFNGTKKYIEDNVYSSLKVLYDEGFKVSSKYKAGFIPQTYIIEKEGKIAKKYFGGRDFGKGSDARKTIDDLLKK